jgi:hypothetical protein
VINALCMMRLVARAALARVSDVLSFGDVERWRPRVVAWLGAAALLLVGYWTGWLVDRGAIAGGSGVAYYEFEQAFPLADLWLLVSVVLAAIQLLRRRPTALIALCAAGSASLYLFGLDFLYDLQHGIYAHGQGGIGELLINLLSAASGVMALTWSWRNRVALLQPRQS